MEIPILISLIRKQQAQPTKMMMMKHILLFSLAISPTNAQDTPVPTALPTFPATNSPSLVPSPAPTPGRPVNTFSTPTPTTTFEGLFGPMPNAAPTRSSSSPTTFFNGGPTGCANNPDYIFDYWEYTNCTWQTLNLTCDDDRVGCFDYNSLGVPVLSNCCKCKPLCSDVCEQWSPPLFPYYDDWNDNCYDNDPYYTDGWGWGSDISDDTGGLPPIVIILLFLFAIAICARVAYNYQGDRPERRNVQQTMAVRRQQQRESHTTPGVTEEERNNARYEKFVTKFHFQQVMPGMTDITAETLRSTGSKPSGGDEEHPTHAEEEEGAISATQPRRSSAMSRRLSSWRRPSATDECVICLEYYQSGETICAPITTECNHVFHESCILEWLKNKDHCPLCRVPLLDD